MSKTVVRNDPLGLSGDRYRCGCVMIQVVVHF